MMFASSGVVLKNEQWEAISRHPRAGELKELLLSYNVHTAMLEVTVSTRNRHHFVVPFSEEFLLRASGEAIAERIFCGLPLMRPPPVVSLAPTISGAKSSDETSMGLTGDQLQTISGHPRFTELLDLSCRHNTYTTMVEVILRAPNGRFVVVEFRGDEWPSLSSNEIVEQIFSAIDTVLAATPEQIARADSLRPLDWE